MHCVLNITYSKWFHTTTKSTVDIITVLKYFFFIKILFVIKSLLCHTLELFGLSSLFRCLCYVQIFFVLINSFSTTTLSHCLNSFMLNFVNFYRCSNNYYHLIIHHFIKEDVFLHSVRFKEKLPKLNCFPKNFN